MIVDFNFSASGYLHQRSARPLILQKQNVVSIMKEFNHLVCNKFEENL